MVDVSQAVAWPDCCGAALHSTHRNVISYATFGLRLCDHGIIISSPDPSLHAEVGWLARLAMVMVEDKLRAAAHVITLCVLWTPFQFSSYHHGIG